MPPSSPPRSKPGKIVANKMLRAMRHIVRHPPEKDRSSIHKPLRKWFEEKPSEFLSRLARMETEQTARLPRFAGKGEKADTQPDVVIGDDDGTVRVRSLLERALEEFHAQSG